MAKKKKPQQNAQILSPAKYIREKARRLPIEACYTNDNWKTSGLAAVMVVRRHQGGSHTVGLYMVDTFCLGVKNSDYRFSLPETEYEDFFDRMDSTIGPLQEISYNEAHNLIYGAIAFAEEAGIQPDRSFDLTQYLLEEDTEDIPLIEYDYGKDGKHFLVAHDRLELNRYMTTLQKHLGDQFNFIVPDEEYEDEYEYEDEEYEDEEYEDDDWTMEDA